MTGEGQPREPESPPDGLSDTPQGAPAFEPVLADEPAGYWFKQGVEPQNVRGGGGVSPQQTEADDWY